MERLTLIAPPENMESYNTKSYCTRKRLYTSRSDDGWAQYFANKDFHIRWVVPWWHIERMMTSDDREGLTISGLWTLTSYFPARLMRQYGRKQVIPDRDTIRPANQSIVSRSLKRWGDFWMAQPKLDVLDLDDCDATTSRFYKKWMSTNNATARAERKDLNRKRPSESETSYEPTPKRSERNNASTVKDRLGPKVAPVWSRLGLLNVEKPKKTMPKKTMPKKWRVKKTPSNEKVTNASDVEKNEDVSSEKEKKD
ncbi:hypothetical protein BVRB_9g226030 [Beta vulgaris subsp. vulgaris]|uniref:Uncharacterized protein n=1 Tax=Beta vulgaris subsp. vulgaris TaxID=3555 RepID=A0A0J8B911_BETVV|nr:hypothetical protein BVRB_9g226030 [Beta vulgaris subsp. vulgaris]